MNEEKIINILNLLDEGKTASEILSLFTEERVEVDKILKLAEMLKANGKSVVPARELLEKTLVLINGVTNFETDRYLYKGADRLPFINKGEKDGRLPITLISIFNQINKSMNFKIFAPIAGLVVLALGIITYFQLSRPIFEGNNINLQFAKRENNPIVQNTQAPAKPTPVPEATGNVDDAVAAILAFADNEFSIDAGQDDSSLVSSDNQMINNFGQSYDETQF